MNGEPVREAQTAELLSEARKGSSHAFAGLIQLYSARLFHFLLSTGLGRQDAEDILQDTLLKAYQNLDRYDSKYSFSTWLFTIGRRLAINHLRDRKKTTPLTVLATAGAPDDGRETREEAASVWRCAAQVLNEQQYSVLWMRYGEDRPFSQIAEQMGLSEQNVRVILHRARTHLSEQLTEGERQ